MVQGMKREIKLTIILLLYSLSVVPQVNRYGTPLISRVDAAVTPGDLRNLCITMDGRGVMYFGSERGGIITYDGSSWDLIPTPGMKSVTSVISDTRGIVYAGGENDFGFLQPAETGRTGYISLVRMFAGRDTANNLAVGAITSAAADSNSVYFSDGMRIFTISAGADSITVKDLASDYGISNVSALLSFDNSLIIADNVRGLFSFKNDELTRIPGGEKTAPSQIVRLLPYDRDNILLGDAAKGMTLFNSRTGNMRNFPAVQPQAGVTGGQTLTDIVLIPGNLIAAGYAGRGGVRIYSHDGVLLQHVSEKTAPVSESSVSAMYCHHSSNSQLWFCTTGFINRAYVSMPASEFTSVSGISSVCGPLAEYGGSIYAGTEDGLIVSYKDASGTRRFKAAGIHAGKVSDLVKTVLSGDEVLIAATDKGLLQIDNNDGLTRFLPGLRLTELCSSKNEPSVIVAGSDDSAVRVLSHDGYEWIVSHQIGDAVKGRVRDIEQTSPGEWWFLTSNPSTMVRMHCEPNDTSFTLYGMDHGVTSDTLNSFSVIDEKLYLCTGRGVFLYNRQEDNFSRDNDLLGTTFDESDIRLLFITPEGEAVISGYDTRNFDALVTATRQGHVVFRRQFDFLPDLATSCICYADDAIWLTKGQSLVVLDKSRLAFRYGDFRTIFSTIVTGSGRVLMEGSFYNRSEGGVLIPSARQPDHHRITLSHRDNSITFRWTTTPCVEEDKTEYRYKLDGFADDWSARERRNLRDYTNLPSGDYVFRVRASTITGLEGEELTYSFSVRKPWYASLVAILLYTCAGAWLLFILIRYFAKRLRIRNRRLDSLLRQRNEATARSRNEIAELENYAGVVQQAILSSETRLRDVFPNSFLLNRPKNAVSGDFFWMADNGERTVLAAGDSTGHGVSSALRTVMALCFLDEITDRPGTMTTSAMLEEFRSRLTLTFGSLDQGEARQEGIDISLLAVDRAGKKIEYSGAAMQCIRVREMNDKEKVRWDNGEFKPNEGTLVSGKYLLETVWGDRVPLGMHLDGDHQFTQHSWKLEKESSYYLFTDGYPDQFNGVTGKKFLKKNLRKLILDIQNYPMNIQKEILEERLGTWMGKSPQTDDILIVGVRIE